MSFAVPFHKKHAVKFLQKLLKTFNGWNEDSHLYKKEVEGLLKLKLKEISGTFNGAIYQRMQFRQYFLLLCC